jgi:hypothetical protein
MNSTLNNQTMSKSMNGLNIGNFDELTTESFSATTLSSTNLAVSGTLTLPANSILDSYLSSNVPLKNADNTFNQTNTFNNLTSYGTFLPIWSSNPSFYTNSYKLGLNVGQSMNTASTKNIAFGNYSLAGNYTNNPAFTRASDNVCLGHFTGYNFSDVAGDNSTSCNRNVLLGNEALLSAFVNTSDNVIIGYQAMRGAAAVDKCVIIGSGALVNNGQGQSRSVVIGADNMKNAGANSEQNTVIGYNNYINNGGNDQLCIGANNLPNASDNNGGIVLGVNNGANHTTGTSCFYFGKNTGNANTTGYNLIMIGNTINLSANNLYNSYYIGHDDNSTGTSIQANDEFVIGGAFNFNCAKLTLPNKNYVYCVQYVSAATFNLTFRKEDTVVLAATTTTINLPTSSSYDFNNGASFTFIKNYSTNVSITVNAPAGKSILDVNGVSQSSIVIPQAIRTFYLKVINNSSATNLWAIDYTAVNASNITTGTLPDSVLSGNVALENITNTFTAVQDFQANIRGIAPSGNVMQLFKNTAGQAGHLLFNGGGDLLYFDSTASLTKWRLNPAGELLLTGTLGAQDITSNYIITNTIFANGNGVQRVRIQTDTAFKYWEYTSNGTYQNYILGGNINYRGSINGNVETCGDITVYNGAKIPFVGGSAPALSRLDLGKAQIGYYNIGTAAYNWKIDNTTGNVTCGGITASGDINAGATNVYAAVIVCNRIDPANGIDIGGSLGKIRFTSALADIRIGNDTTLFTDTTTNNLNIGNSSQALGGDNVCLGYLARAGDAAFPVRGQGAVVIGGSASSLGEYSTVCGHASSAARDAVAVGRGGTAQIEGVCIGKNTTAGQKSVSAGSGALCGGTESVALGYFTNCSGNQSVCLGETTTATAATAIAIGAEAQANGISGISCGYQARANFQNSCSIGAGVQTAAINEFRLGNATNQILLKQLYFPFEISPTNITATGGLPASPYYGIYRISAGVSITITLPAITAAMEGMIITFRKTGALTIVVSITCSAGNTYLPLNSTTSTAAGTNTTLLNTSSVTGRVMVISGSQWAVCT